MAVHNKIEKKDKESKTSKVSKKEYIHAIGRRKQAIARVQLYSDFKEDVTWKDQVIKKGNIFVNEKPISEYFSGQVSKVAYEEPFKLTNTLNKFAVTIRISGGGLFGQLDASVLAIARALIIFDPSFRSILKKKGLLSRDSRVRERRKVGTGGKARRKKQSPKR